MQGAQTSQFTIGKLDAGIAVLCKSFSLVEHCTQSQDARN